MWDQNTTCRESDEDAIAENVDVPDIFEAPFGAKRRRRPSVRLEDLGDQHAAPSADRRKKKLGMPALPHTGKTPAHSNESLPLSSFVPNRFKTDRGLNTRPGVNANNAGVRKHSSFDDGDDAQKAELPLSCCMDSSAELQPAFENATGRNKLQKLLRITSKKARNGNRKSGVRKVGTSVKRSASMPPSGTLTRGRCKGKVSSLHNVKDMHFDKENNVQAPTAFEASGYHNVVGTLDRRGHSEQGEMVLLHANRKHQSGDHWPACAQIRGTRTHQSSSRRQAFKLTDRKFLQATGSVYVPKGKLIVRANGSLHGTGNNTVVEANGNGDSRGPSIRHIVRQSPGPWLGVTEWLQGLGLRRYAELFEAHEVEPEVLPLLTLDDLREMGVAAVGSRRKIFHAIQHFKKALPAEVD